MKIDFNRILIFSKLSLKFFGLDLVYTQLRDDTKTLMKIPYASGIITKTKEEIIMTTLEQVEKLRTMANISYDEAKGALDAANGDFLEAIIYLEKQGTINNHSNCGKPCTSLIKKIGSFCMEMFRKGNANSFEVLKGEEIKVSVPVTVLALLLIFAFWITLPLIIVGLFFGLRYRFRGPDFAGNTVNDAMNSAADAAINLKKSI